MFSREQFDLFFRRQVIHLQRREPVKLRGINAERAAELTPAVHGCDELHVVRNVQKLIVDGIEQSAARIEGRHQHVAGVFGTAIEFVQKHQITAGRVGLSIAQRGEQFGRDEVRYWLPGCRGANLDRGQKVGRFEHRSAIEEHEPHPQLIGDRPREDGLSAALRAIQQNVQTALQSDLQLLRDNRIEINAFEAKFELLHELDFDRAAVGAVRLADGNDFHLRRDSGTNPRIVAEHHLRGAFAIEVRCPETKLGFTHRVRPEGGAHHRADFHVIDIQFFGHRQFLRRRRRKLNRRAGGR